MGGGGAGWAGGRQSAPERRHQRLRVIDMAQGLAEAGGQQHRRLVAGDLVEIARGKGRTTKVRWMTTYHSGFFVIEVAGVHEHARQVDRWCTIDAATLFLSWTNPSCPASWLLGLIADVELRDKVFVAGEHHHHQQAADQRHVDQRQHQQDEIGLGGVSKACGRT